MDLVISSIGQGILWSIVGLGLFISFRILNFPDMTIEGSYSLGAAVCVATLSKGVSPIIATLCGFLIGCVAGLISGLLYTKGKIPIILAGILVTTAAYSINLMIMGKSNIGLLNIKTLMNGALFNIFGQYTSIIIGLIVVAIVIGSLSLFFQTNLGQAFIASGDNPVMARANGIYTNKMFVLGLVVSNGLVGLCGALIAQSDGYFDIGNGGGVLVIALASLVIGEVVFGNLTLNARLVAVVLGSIIYRLVILLVLKINPDTNNLKLWSAVILGIFLIIPQISERMRLKKIIKNGVKSHE